MSRKIENTIRAFRQARIEGEKMLSQGRITQEDFAFCMAGYEQQLKALEVDF